MKVYFAGKFNMLKDKKKDLSERLINDYRSKILGDSKRITLASDNVMINMFIVDRSILNKLLMEILLL